MTKLYFWSRRLAVLTTAGMVFQSTGCAVDTQALVANLAVTILQNLIGSYIFGSFNLVP